MRYKEKCITQKNFVIQALQPSKLIHISRFKSLLLLLAEIVRKKTFSRYRISNEISLLLLGIIRILRTYCAKKVRLSRGMYKVCKRRGKVKRVQAKKKKITRTVIQQKTVERNIGTERCRACVSFPRGWLKRTSKKEGGKPDYFVLGNTFI